MLQYVTLGFALAEADLDVAEVGGNNRGPRIQEHLANVDPPIHTAAPWCAAALQYWSDVAARSLVIPNPLDGVRLEALVQSYVDWAERPDTVGYVIKEADAEPGDIVCYRFGSGGRWNHIGLFVRWATADPPGMFYAVEGNTPLEAAPESEQRDSRDKVDGVAVKGRTTLATYPVQFIRWSP